jgi:threonine aldolase
MNTNRRNFLRSIGLSAIPMVVSAEGMAHIGESEVLENAGSNPEKTFVNFVSDGLRLSPTEYLQKVAELDKVHPVEQDTYGSGGTTMQLETAYAKVTGKEKAIFIPTGTMANQLAMKLLSGDRAKIAVPENSHIYRDEADAAQSVHGKRLVPVGKDKPFFTAEDLKTAMEYHDNGEVFGNGWGAVVVENPVRRAGGAAAPVETLKAISAYCRTKGIKLHLDGARLHIAAAFSGVSIAEYSSYFDTVYISLYKYLNAPQGAILCGEASLIDKIPHLIKVYGGTLYRTWTSTSIALHYLNGLEERWKSTVKEMETLVATLNKMDGIKVSKIEYGTNIYDLALDKRIDVQKLAYSLTKNHNILLGPQNSEGVVRMAANESILRTKADLIAAAFKKSIADAAR